MRNLHTMWILLSVLCSSVAHFSLKLGALRLTLDGGLAHVMPRIATNGWLILGAALHALALALWVVGLMRVELSTAYPFIALGLVLVSLLSCVFLGESLNATRLLGIVLIGSGVVLVARS